MAYKVISLFSGCGGFDLGFKMAGFEIAWANDTMKDACNTYRNNISDNIICDDINNIILNTIPYGDVLIAGPPCQPFSMIGKRQLTDSRKDLIWKFVEAIEILRPRIFVMENVLGLKSALTSNGESLFDILLKSFSKIGYFINYDVLNAANFGIPQLRKRLFIIGSIEKKIRFPNFTNIDSKDSPLTGDLLPLVTTYDALDDMPEPDIDGFTQSYLHEPRSAYQIWLRKDHRSKIIHNHWLPGLSDLDKKIISYVRPGGNYNDVPSSIPSKRIQTYKKTGGRTTTYGRLSKNRPSYTINTYFSRPNVGCNIHYRGGRLITIREGLRLQSFPDNYIIPDKMSKRSQYTLVGNAVPPLLGFAIGRQLINQI